MAGRGKLPRLSRQQSRARDGLIAWWEEGASPYVTLGGYAGTGKTTLLARTRKAFVRKARHLKVAFCCFTGKASRVLNAKLRMGQVLKEKDFCGTIHSLIYSPIYAADGRIIGWQKREEVPYDLIVVDEASMVSEEIWRDMQSFGVRTIAVGDHGQLPPIEGEFNLMQAPELKLEEIHRQVAGNPIIRLSMLARLEGKIPAGEYGRGVRKLKAGEDETEEFLDAQYSRLSPDTMVICAFNRSRIRLNHRIRGLLGFEGFDPVPGERLICLRNNWLSRQCQICNGMQGTLRSIRKIEKNGRWDWYEVSIKIDGEEEPYEGLISRHQLDKPQRLFFVEGVPVSEIGDLFDRGYALTVHKAQGSQARKVILLEQYGRTWSEDEKRRWLYTAVTRAEEELFIVG